MGFMAHSPPNYAAAKASGIDYSGPARVVAIVSQPVFAQVNGELRFRYRQFAMLSRLIVGSLVQVCSIWSSLTEEL